MEIGSVRPYNQIPGFPQRVYHREQGQNGRPQNPRRIHMVGQRKDVRVTLMAVTALSILKMLLENLQRKCTNRLKHRKMASRVLQRGDGQI